MGSFEVIAVGQLAALGVASGLLLTLTLQPKQGRADRLFFAFCLLLLVWSLASLAQPNANRPLMDVQTRTSFLLTGLSGTVVLYFLFIARLLRVENRLVTGLTLLLPAFGIGALIVIWTGMVGTLTGAASVGYVLLIALLLYAGIAFWSIMISREPVARPLRGAGVLLLIAYLAPLTAFSNLELSLILVASAALWTGWVVLRRQLEQPLKDLGDELRIANRDLRQAVADVVSERARSAALNEQFRSAAQSRSEFLEELGHRLRTPLNSINGYNQLLQSGVYGDMSDIQIDRLKTIGRNSQVLLELISDMLDLNTLDAGRMQLSLQPVTVKSLFDTIAQQVEAERAAKSLSLIIDVPPDLSLIYADLTRMSRVLKQLTVNAIKSSKAGTVTLRAVNTRVQDGFSAQFPLPVRGWLGDGDWVIISVEDTGVGIAPEDQSKIFEPFYAPGDTAPAEFIGSGLGLAISKRLIERHDGVIWLKSTPEHGSMFLVALRAFRPAAVPAALSRAGEKEIIV